MDTVEIFRAFVTLIETPVGPDELAREALDVIARAARHGQLPAAFEAITQA